MYIRRDTGIKWVNSVVIDYISIPFILFLCFWLCRHAFDLWWTYDDPYIMTSVIFDSYKDIFFDPGTYRTISIFSFFPFIFLSLKLDYFFFGFEPFWFYIHHVLSLSCVALGIYISGRKWNKLFSLMGSSFFLFTGPAFLAGHILMLRHYIEGAALSLLSFIVLFYAPKNRLAQWLGAFLYLLACLNKEVYLVLFFAVPFFLRGTLSDRVIASIPYGLMLSVYMIWRFYMLPQAGIGPDMGQEGLIGYWHGWAWFFTVFGNILANVWSAELYGSKRMLFIILHLLIFLMILYFVYNQYGSLSYIAGIAVLLLVSLLVIFPRWENISGYFLSYRLIFHFSVLYAFGLILALTCCFSQKSHRITKLIVFTMITMVFFCGWSSRIDHKQETYGNKMAVHSANYEFYYLESQNKTLVVNTLDHHWSDLGRLRKYFKGDYPPQVCYRPFDLRDKETTYYEFSIKDRDFMDITSDLLDEKIFLLKNITRDEHFHTLIKVENGTLTVKIGPDEIRGSKYILLGDDNNIYWGLVPVGSHFSIAMTMRPITLYVRSMIRFKDESLILSPEWTINLAENKTIRFSNFDINIRGQKVSHEN